jgi:hypothetical protein
MQRQQRPPRADTSHKRKEKAVSFGTRPFL